MQRKTKLIAATAAAGLLTLGGLAGLASADMGEGMMGGGMAGGMMGGGPRHMRLCQGHGEGRGMMGDHMMGLRMMERYDANKDGKVTQAEIDENRKQWLAEFDADKNGTLTLDEFKLLWMKSRNEMMVRQFQFFDKDGSGQVTLEEYQGPMSGLVARRDANNDGSLGADDRPMMGKGQGWRHGMGSGGPACGRGDAGPDDGGDTDAPAQQPPAEDQPNP